MENEKDYLDGFAEGAGISRLEAAEVAHEYAGVDFAELTYEDGQNHGQYHKSLSSAT